jgi:hypothetical protein
MMFFRLIDLLEVLRTAQRVHAIRETTRVGISPQRAIRATLHQAAWRRLVVASWGRTIIEV